MVKSSAVTLVSLAICWSALQAVVDGKTELISTRLDRQPQDSAEDGSQGDALSTIEMVSRAHIALALVDGLFTISDKIDERISPQPTTADDLLDSLKRLNHLLRPDEESKYKNVEDVVVRALVDMSVMEEDNTSPSSKMQKLLWLERARLINGNIVLLMDALLGRRAAGADLLNNVARNKKCDIVKMWGKMERYRDLISDGSMAVNHFARLGHMSNLELNRRTAAVGDRNVKLVDHNIQLVNTCLKRQLNETWKVTTTTGQLAGRVGQVLSNLRTGPTRWIVAVHATERQPLRNFKSKLSATYALHLNGFDVALFPFAEGDAPVGIDGWAVDEFCRRPIREAGGMRTCDVGSNDGEFIYDGLRHDGIVPDAAHLIVVPVAGQLTITTVPPGSLPTFFARRYPDFDIVAF